MTNEAVNTNITKAKRKFVSLLHTVPRHDWDTKEYRRLRLCFDILECAGRQLWRPASEYQAELHADDLDGHFMTCRHISRIQRNGLESNDDAKREILEDLDAAKRILMEEREDNKNRAIFAARARQTILCVETLLTAKLDTTSLYEVAEMIALVADGYALHGKK